MFQYAFAKGYAVAMDCVLHTPDWWGRKVFLEAEKDPFIEQDLPKTHCDSAAHSLKHPLAYFFGKKGIDLSGYFQHQVFLNLYTRKQILEWFKIKPEWEEMFSKFGIDINKPDYSAMHLRRGDYTSDPTFQKLYCTVSEQSYEKAKNKFNIPKPVIVVYDGWKAPVDNLKSTGLEWLMDFLTLKNASHLLRSNSTFSWWAAALGSGKVYSPIVGKLVGLQDVEFTVGNWPNTAGIFPNQSDLYIRWE